MNNINVPISKDEIIAAMRQTKNGKATGSDKIAIETLRLTRDNSASYNS